MRFSLVTPIVTTSDHCSQISNSALFFPSSSLFFVSPSSHMNAQPNLSAELDVLRRIHRTAVAIIEGCNPHISKPTPVFDTSILPFPHAIMKLPEAGGTRQELLRCFINRFNEPERFLSSFRSACSMITNANDLDATKQQRKNCSKKKTFNNVGAYGFSHVCPSNLNFRNIRPYLRSILSTMHTHLPQIDRL